MITVHREQVDDEVDGELWMISAVDAKRTGVKSLVEGCCSGMGMEMEEAGDVIVVNRDCLLWQVSGKGATLVGPILLVALTNEGSSLYADKER